MDNTNTNLFVSLIICYKPKVDNTLGGRYVPDGINTPFFASNMFIKHENHSKYYEVFFSIQ